MRLNNIIILLSLLATLLLGGCINDDRDGCIINTTKLNLKYFADGDKDVLFDYVDRVTIFAYNSSSGELVATHELLLNDNSKASFEFENLPEGSYSFIAWGNLSHNSQVNGSAGLSGAIVGLNTNTETSKGVSSDPLYFARKDVEVLDISTNTIDLILNSAHIKFDISVKGLSEIPNLLISQQVKGFDMGMNIIGGGFTDLHPVLDKGDLPNYFSGQFNVLRPEASFLESKLTLITSDKDKHEIKLKDFIAKYYPNLLISKTQEIKIEVLFEFSDLGVIATVPNWDMDEDTGSEIE